MSIKQYKFLEDEMRKKLSIHANGIKARNELDKPMNDILKDYIAAKQNKNAALDFTTNEFNSTQKFNIEIQSWSLENNISLWVQYYISFGCSYSSQKEFINLADLFKADWKPAAIMVTKMLNAKLKKHNQKIFKRNANLDKKRLKELIKIYGIPKDL